MAAPAPRGPLFTNDQNILITGIAPRLTELNAQIRETIGSNQGFRDRVLAQITAMRAVAAQIRTKMNEFRNAVGPVLAQRDVLQGRLDALTAQQAESVDQIRILTQRANDLERQLREDGDERNRLTQELNQIRQSLVDHNNQRDDIMRQMDLINNGLDETTRSYTTLSTENDATILQLQHELDELQRELNETLAEANAPAGGPAAGGPGGGLPIPPPGGNGGGGNIFPPPPGYGGPGSGGPGSGGPGSGPINNQNNSNVRSSGSGRVQHSNSPFTGAKSYQSSTMNPSSRVFNRQQQQNSVNDQNRIPVQSNDDMNIRQIKSPNRNNRNNNNYLDLATLNNNNLNNNPNPNNNVKINNFFNQPQQDQDQDQEHHLTGRALEDQQKSNEERNKQLNRPQFHRRGGKTKKARKTRKVGGKKNKKHKSQKGGYYAKYAKRRSSSRRSSANRSSANRSSANRSSANRRSSRGRRTSY